MYGYPSLRSTSCSTLSNPKYLLIIVAVWIARIKPDCTSRVNGIFDSARARPAQSACSLPKYF